MGGRLTKTMSGSICSPGSAPKDGEKRTESFEVNGAGEDSYEHIIESLVQKYGCSLSSAQRTYVRHPTSLEDCFAELEVKMGPCVVAVNAYRDLLNYAKETLQDFPTTVNHSLPYLRHSHRNQPLSGGASDVSNGSMHDGTGNSSCGHSSSTSSSGKSSMHGATLETPPRTWGDVVNSIKSMPGPVKVFEVPYDEVRLVDFDDSLFEQFYEDNVLKEDLRDVVLFFSCNDGSIPLTDYLNWRHFTKPRDGEPLVGADGAGDTTEGSGSVAKVPQRTRNLFGNDPGTSRRMRQWKHTMQDTLRDQGIKYIWSAKGHTVEEVEKLRVENDIPFPIIVKPVSSGGSQFVTLCHDLKETAVAMSLGDGMKTTQNTDCEMMIQEYVEGEEYVIDVVSYNGVHVISDMWRSLKVPQTVLGTRLLSSEEDKWIKECSEGKRDTLPPSHVTTSLLYDRLEYIEDLGSLDADSVERRVADYTLRCLDALEMRNGSSHCEVRVDQRQQSKEYGMPVLIELNPRPQGDKPRGTPLVGYDQFFLMAYLATCAVAIKEVPGAGNLLPWPPAPQYYGSAQAEKPREMRDTRYVLFLRCKTGGVICTGGANAILRLPTFAYQTRQHSLDPATPGSVRSVSITTDLLSSPGALVFHGQRGDIDRDIAIVRAIEETDVPSTWRVIALTIVAVKNMIKCESELQCRWDDVALATSQLLHLGAITEEGDIPDYLQNQLNDIMLNGVEQEARDMESTSVNPLDPVKREEWNTLRAALGQIKREVSMNMRNLKTVYGNCITASDPPLELSDEKNAYLTRIVNSSVLPAPYINPEYPDENYTAFLKVLATDLQSEAAAFNSRIRALRILQQGMIKIAPEVFRRAPIRPLYVPLEMFSKIREAGLGEQIRNA